MNDLEGLEPLPTGEIYSIEVGMPKQGFRYTVGQSFILRGKEIKIVEIIRDDNSYFLHGNTRYIIYAAEDECTDIFCWKYYENIPIQVTCYM